MKCPKCAQEAGSGRFCRSCGTPVATASSPAAGGACPACGAEVRPGAKFCGSCAAPLSAPAQAPPAVATTICVNCGAEAKADTKFCKVCGKAVASGAPPAAARVGVTPDMEPTAMMGAPVRQAPPTPPQPPPPAMAEAPRPARVPTPAAPRAEAPAAPRLVPKAEAAPRPAAMEPPRAGGSNRTLILVTVVVLALVAAGAVYKFVLKKPAAQTVQSTPAVETPATAQTAAPATPEPTPEPTSPDAAQTSSETQPAADATPTPAPPAGNGPTAGGTGAAPPKAPKKSPAKPSGPAYAQAHANAEQAFAASQYLTPPDGSALFWARKAKALGDPAAAQIEQQVFTKQMSDVTAARQGHLYDQALAQLYQVASNFPEHSELKSMQDEIHQEQQRYNQQMEEQRRQAELAAQTKKFPVQHRHGTGESSCTGIISVTPDGIGHYDCTTADGKGRCEHVTFAADSLKEVKVRGDGSLHIATRQQGNFDFTGGDFSMRDAASALSKLVKR